MSAVVNLFGSPELDQTLSTIGTSYLGETETELLKQVLVAVANRSGGGGGGGTGDVNGPASSTDNAIVRFNGVGGKIVQNSGITIADGASGTLSGTNTGDQNLFSTIAVSGQSNVVADSTGDTLTLVAGTNVTITTDPSTDSVTINASSGSGAITGEGKLWFTSTAPTGWLLCDGSAVSRTTYAALFAVIGTTYGPGDGSTTFNVPDMNGRVPAGYSGVAPYSSLGNQFGNEESELPDLSTGTYAAGEGATNVLTSVEYSSSSTVSVLQPATVVNFIIKT